MSASMIPPKPCGLGGHHVAPLQLTTSIDWTRGGVHVVTVSCPVCGEVAISETMPAAPPAAYLTSGPEVSPRCGHVVMGWRCVLHLGHHAELGHLCAGVWFRWWTDDEMMKVRDAGKNLAVWEEERWR